MESSARLRSSSPLFLRCPRLQAIRGPQLQPSAVTALPADDTLDAATLHAHWKPTRDRLVRQDTENDLRVRIHRACAALRQGERAESDGTAEGRDASIVFRWVALNALYGDWDWDAGMPARDRQSLDRFTTELSRADSEGRIRRTLEAHAEDARALLESPFLIERFWRDGEWDQVRPQRGRARNFNEELRSERTSAALHRVLMVIYFLRCQIVHGGATMGSSVNRVTVDPAARLLRALSGQIIAVSMERGLEMSWGELCYPPVPGDGSS